MNGKETDSEQIVAKIKEQVVSQRGKVDVNNGRPLEDDVAENEDAQTDGGHESDVTQYSEDSETGSNKVEKNMEDVSQPSPEPEPPKRRVGRPKGFAKKQG